MPFSIGIGMGVCKGGGGVAIPANALLWDDSTPLLWDDSTYLIWS